MVVSLTAIQKVLGSNLGAGEDTFYNWRLSSSMRKDIWHCFPNLVPVYSGGHLFKKFSCCSWQIILTLGGGVTLCFEYLTPQILCCIWLNIDCAANNILAVSKQHVDRNSFVHTNETHATLDQLQHHRMVLSIELPSAGKHQNSRRSLADRGILGKTCRLWLHNVHARSIMHTPNTHPT